MASVTTVSGFSELGSFVAPGRSIAYCVAQKRCGDETQLATDPQGEAASDCGFFSRRIVRNEHPKPCVQKLELVGRQR